VTPARAALVIAERRLIERVHQLDESLEAHEER
jgi:hypothetical protein